MYKLRQIERLVVYYLSEGPGSVILEILIGFGGLFSVKGTLSSGLFLSYFEKKVHMSVVWAVMYLCIFVSLCVRMFVARANKVKGTMSWCLGTNEILASI